MVDSCPRRTFRGDRDRAILLLLLDLQKEMGNTILLVSHDMGVHFQVTKKMLIMYAAKVVEYADTDDIFQRPLHPYTVMLTNSLPTIGDDRAIDASWAGDASIREGTPVVNQRGELVALCSHADGVGRLVPLANLDQLQQAITSYTGQATVWMGIALGDDQDGGLAISAVDPAGPAATAGLTSGDVILTLDGTSLTEHIGLTDLLAAHRPGDVVEVGVRRADGSSATFRITLAQPKTTL